MTPDGVRARLDALREAGARMRARAPQEVLALLARALDVWSDPASAWRRELEAKLPAATGFAPETVRRGLSRALTDWNGDALRRLAARELGAAHSGFETCAVVLAGSIPMPTLKALVAPLALGTPVLAKPASRDPVTAELVARSLAEIDPGLGACVGLAPLSRADAGALDALLAAECVVVYGDDATVAELSSRSRARRFLAHGHRLSLAVLGADAQRGEALRDAAAGLAEDVALWDQLGCLSPIALYAVGADAETADRVAGALAAALRDAAKRWPRGMVEPAAAARFASERAEAELRAAAGGGVAVHADPAGRWCVVREADARARPAPLHRFVRVHPVRDLAALDAALAPLRRHLAGVALAGFAAEQPEVARALAAGGASLVCAPGSLQAPSLAWESEGRGVLASLARVAAGQG
ncbi:MAG TPA: acyl-CoA reductase [Myxococcota bacterium]|nr:acyl-CoA reductase [Myxococcota bacterium]